MIWHATLIGLAAGVVGTGAGGLIAAVIGRLRKDSSAAMLGFSAGIMLAIVGADLFPEAIRRGGLLWAALGTVLGVGLIYGLDILVPHAHPRTGETTARIEDHRHERDQRRAKYSRLALLLALGVSFHNLPEGVAVGSGYASGTAFGLAVVALIFFQNIPEGLAVAAPYILAGNRRPKAIGMAALTGVPQVAGAALGAAVAAVSPLIMSLALSFAAGAMLFIVGDELLLEAHRMARGHTVAMALVAGMLAGMTLSALLAGV